jgi:hypothetical protein
VIMPISGQLLPFTKTSGKLVEGTLVSGESGAATKVGRTVYNLHEVLIVHLRGN